jgi:gliding motility-associated-like protein
MVDDIVVTVNPLPEILFTPNITIGCDPVTVNFSTTSTGVSCVWDFGDGSTDTLCGATSHTYLGVGCYDVSLVSTDVNGCINSSTLTNLICLVPHPVSAFTINPPVISTTYPVSTLINTSSGSVSYVWDFGDGSVSTLMEPTHTFPFTEGGNYTVMLISDNGYGCTDTSYQTIRVLEDVIFYVPNAFTPDGDDNNQYFKPIFTSGFDPFNYTLLIYNRWGELIFESHNISIGWDGKYYDAYVQDGTYTWEIQFGNSMNDGKVTKTGHLTIIR